MKTAIVSLFLIGLFPAAALAQADLVPDAVHIERARVVQVQDSHEAVVPGTDTRTAVQTITAEVLDGADKGKVVTFENDYTPLSAGELFFIRHQSNSLDGTDYWTVSDPYRLNVLLYLTIGFLVLLFTFGGMQGVRGIASLLGSLVLIFYVLLPGILAGYSPVFVSIGVASLIIVVGSYITHGFTRTTTAAVLGMIITVILTGATAYVAVHAAHLTGYASEESVYLNLDMRGTTDLVGLLFGGIMIGLLGVLYDIAIGQAVAIEELFRAGREMTRLDVYRRGVRIGREHIGALVNTLAIAYVGVSLPLLLLIKNSSTVGLASMINSEVFATEIIRTLVGSTGLIIAVPITTLIASYLLECYRGHPAGPTSGHHHAH